MYAIQTMFVPELLDGELMDRETHKPVDKKKVAQMITASSKGIQQIMDLEAGIFSLTGAEYLRLPNAFLQTRRIYQRVKAENG